MFIRNLNECGSFISGDGAILREFLHPDKTDVAVRYSLAHAVVKPDVVTKPHRLRTAEVYYIISGKGIMHIDQEQAPVKEGASVYIPPEAVQYIENAGEGDLQFLCIVDPAWRPQDEEIL